MRRGRPDVMQRQENLIILNTDRKAGKEICRPFLVVSLIETALFHLPTAAITASSLSINSGTMVMPRARNSVCTDDSNLA